MEILTFTEFCKRQTKRKLVYESIYNKIIKESKRFAIEFQKQFYSGKAIVFEDIQSMVAADLHQSEQDIQSMNNFVEEYKKLNSQDKLQLVDQLIKPLPGNKYIEGNNELKLILIYKNDPDSEAGQKAYEAIILNKQKWFEIIAGKAAATGKIPPNQAADYAQQMVLTLLGGGSYNEKNGKKFSLDAYDPYSGVPFNSFVNTYIVNSAGNKFNAKFNKSVATDYSGSKMNVVSTDTPINNGSMSDDKEGTLLDTIPDNNEFGDSPANIMSNEEQKKLLQKYLNNPKLNSKEREAIKLRYGLQSGREMTLLDIGLKLGYPKSSAIQNARRIVSSAQSKLKQFARQNFKR